MNNCARTSLRLQNVLLKRFFIQSNLYQHRKFSQDKLEAVDSLKRESVCNEKTKFLPGAKANETEITKTDITKTEITINYHKNVVPTDQPAQKVVLLEQTTSVSTHEATISTTTPSQSPPSSATPTPNVSTPSPAQQQPPNNPPAPAPATAHIGINAGLTPDIEAGRHVAIDCEMVGVGYLGRVSALARVSVVDFRGRQLYDSFVLPEQPVTDWRTPLSGVTPEHMRRARTFSAVQLAVARLIVGRVLVGHGVGSDLRILGLRHPPWDVRDTAHHAMFVALNGGRPPALRVLARALLGITIQSGAHSSVEDARVAMFLFRQNKLAIDDEYASLYGQRVIMKSDGLHDKN